jgi:hypothetical protein
MLRNNAVNPDAITQLSQHNPQLILIDYLMIDEAPECGFFATHQLSGGGVCGEVAYRWLVTDVPLSHGSHHLISVIETSFVLQP